MINEGLGGSFLLEKHKDLLNSKSNTQLSSCNTEYYINNLHQLTDYFNQVKEMMRQADKDGDGLVSFEEFKDIMCSKVQTLSSASNPKNTSPGLNLVFESGDVTKDHVRVVRLSESREIEHLAPSGVDFNLTVLLYLTCEWLVMCPYSLVTLPTTDQIGTWLRHTTWCANSESVAA